MILATHGVASSKASDSLKITVTFASAPVTATSAIPKMKYNKNKAILFEFDDDSIYLLTAWNKLINTYYTDGCGNNINYSCGLAVNARNNFNGFEWAGGTFSDKCTYAQRDSLIPLGLDIMNHAYYHDQSGNYPLAGDNWTYPGKNFSELNQFIFDKDGGYKMNGLVVPSNYTGYQLEAQAGGYLFGSSQGTFDTFTSYPTFNALGTINSTPKVSYSARRRNFSDSWIDGATQWTMMNSLFSGSNDFFEIGSHNIGDGVNFNSWIDSIVTQSADTTLFQSMREFMEYKHLKDYVTKTEQISSNTMTITLDYSTVVNQRISWFDLSLIVTSDKAITNVSIDRGDFTATYNTTTKLINVKKRKISWA